MADTPTRQDPRLRSCVMLQADQVAELLGVSSRSVWRMAAAGDIPAPVKIGPRLVRWRLATLERYLEGLK